MQQTTSGNGTTLISAGTKLKGDISSSSDLRIDGDISGNQADIVGKVSGNIHAKELLQLRGESVVTGNLYAGKLQIEPTATFNGQCHMGANIVELNSEMTNAINQ